MKITFENTYKKHYIEILPSFSISKHGTILIYLGWLFWSIMIKFR